MFKRKKRRAVPSLSTMATADISFMMLVFFLVTTSMDSERGMVRTMPPLPESQEEVEREISHDKVLMLSLDAEGNLTSENEQITSAEVAARVKELAVAFPTEHVVFIETSPETSYESYFSLQNTVVNAYQSLRNEYAEKHFHKPFQQCTVEEKNEIIEALPQRISEEQR